VTVSEKLTRCQDNSIRRPGSPWSPAARRQRPLPASSLSHARPSACPHAGVTALLSGEPSVGDGCEHGRAGAPCTSNGLVGVCSISSWATVRAGVELFRSQRRDTGKSSIPVDASACTASQGPVPMVPTPALGQEPAGSLGGCPCPSHRIPGPGWCGQGGKHPSPSSAELPRLTRRPNEASTRRLIFVHQYLISASLTRRPIPVRLRRAAFVCCARRQTAAGKRLSITAPFSLSPRNKGRKRGWRLRWETGAACVLPLCPCPRDGMRCPRGGFGLVSKFLGLSEAARRGDPKVEVWDGFLEEEELRGDVGLCPRGAGGMSVMPASSLGGLPAETLHFGKRQNIWFQDFLGTHHHHLSVSKLQTVVSKGT